MPGPGRVDMWRWCGTGGAQLAGRRVLVAAVGVGNVAQLAGDLLVSSLGLARAATLHSPALLPLCGADPYTLRAPALASAADLYLAPAPAPRLALLLFRAPLVPRRTRAFLTDLLISLKEFKVGEVIILTSSFAHEKREIMTSQFRYYANELYDADVVSLHLRKHEKLQDKLVIHGGGFAALLLDICTAHSMPALILFKYSSEGDNIPDAYEMVATLSRLVPLFSEDKPLESQLREPISWRLLFGGPPPKEIY